MVLSPLTASLCTVPPLDPCPDPCPWVEERKRHVQGSHPLSDKSCQPVPGPTTSTSLLSITFSHPNSHLKEGNDFNHMADLDSQDACSPSGLILAVILLCQPPPRFTGINSDRSPCLTATFTSPAFFCPPTQWPVGMILDNVGPYCVPSITPYLVTGLI